MTNEYERTIYGAQPFYVNGEQLTAFADDEPAEILTQAARYMNLDGMGHAEKVEELHRAAAALQVEADADAIEQAADEITVSIWAASMARMEAYND